MQNHAQQRAVDGEFAVVLDEPQPAELVHEEINAGPGSANHLREGFLADPGDLGSLLNTVVAKAGKEQKDSGETLFAGIEQLIDQVFLVADILGKQVFHEDV